MNKARPDLRSGPFTCWPWGDYLTVEDQSCGSSLRRLPTKPSPRRPDINRSVVPGSGTETTACRDTCRINGSDITPGIIRIFNIKVLGQSIVDLVHPNIDIHRVGKSNSILYNPCTETLIIFGSTIEIVSYTFCDGDDL